VLERQSSSSFSRTPRTSASISTLNGAGGSAGSGSIVTSMCGSVRRNWVTRIFDRPCTSTFSRPSGSRIMRMTMPTTPTV
jgi:hypothetical protein